MEIIGGVRRERVEIMRHALGDTITLLFNVCWRLGSKVVYIMLSKLLDKPSSSLLPSRCHKSRKLIKFDSKVTDAEMRCLDLQAV